MQSFPASAGRGEENAARLRSSPLQGEGKDFVILSVAKNPGSFSVPTTAPSTTDQPLRRPVVPKISASANPGFFASLQNDTERFARSTKRRNCNPCIRTEQKRNLESRAKDARWIRTLT